MAKTFTPKDAHQVMNLLLKQATGQSAVSVVDSSSFASAGELVLATGMENVFNSLNIVLNRLVVASRAYNAKLRIVSSNEVGAYSNRARKISFYSQFALPDGSHNTDLYTNLAQGYTSGDNGGASTKSQWEQHQPMPLEMNFGGTNVWQYCITNYEDQIKLALRDDAEFARFVSGYLQEHANDIEQSMEGFYRMTLLNRMAMTYDMSADMPGAAIDLTAAFNAFYNTSYTGAQLRSTYLKEFLAFMTATIKEVSDYMEERTNKYHWSVPKTVGGETYHILRHTPKDRQKLVLYSPLFRKAEALVLPEIFNPQYLSIENYEAVSFWQSDYSDLDDLNRPRINVTPAIIETDSTDPAYGTQIKGAAVSLDYVVGFLFDSDAVLAEMQLDRVDSTPVEARKHYRNTWNTFAKNAISDPTENAVLFYMS
jgi:hypothetical protein